MSRALSVIAIAGLFVSLWLVPAPATATAPARSLSLGHAMGVGGQLRSANGAYVLTLRPNGGMDIRTGTRTVWRANSSGPNAYLAVRGNGDLQLISRRRLVWHTATAGSGSHNGLTLGNDGVLKLANPVGVVWSSRLGNGCLTTAAAHQVNIDISTQLARFCSARQQVLVSYVTTGASLLGNGTPTGNWRVQAKVANTVLHPAGGGAYPVRFWVPYNGAYGLHDSSWQHFAYGSAQYRTNGSHGCVHVPPRVMAWFFGWAPIGTVVSIGM
ncbi:MAG: L,D-transpeptidase family protein [Actinomycetota bacterium]|nr:L,D-transpeptidase family protein [Actinomycetota bacterium]